MPKRITAAFIATSLCASMLPSASALDLGRGERDAVKQSADSAGRIIRVLEREPDADRPMSADETREMLRSLGMPEQAIENLGEKELRRYASSPKIYTSDAYIRTDSLGRMTYVTKADAVMGAIEQKSAFSPLASGSDTYRDSYMNLYFIAADLDDGNGTYLFATNALWLTMPNFRWKDGVGAVAQDVAIDYSTMTGYYQYRQERYYNGVLQSTLLPAQTRTTLSRYDFQAATDSTGTFYGIGTIVNLPNDTRVPVDDMEIYHTDYFVHTEFEANMRYPTFETYFNAIGSYVHKTLGLGGAVSITVDTSGAAAVGLGLHPVENCDGRHVPLRIHYVP